MVSEIFVRVKPKIFDCIFAYQLRGFSGLEEFNDRLLAIAQAQACCDDIPVVYSVLQHMLQKLVLLKR